MLQERWACRVQRWHHRGDVVFRTGRLVYNSQHDNKNVILLKLEYLMVCILKELAFEGEEYSLLINIC